MDEGEGKDQEAEPSNVDFVAGKIRLLHAYRNGTAEVLKAQRVDLKLKGGGTEQGRQVFHSWINQCQLVATCPLPSTQLYSRRSPRQWLRTTPLVRPKSCGNEKRAVR